MKPSNDPRCLQCGRPDAGERLQCLCGASLLVDVVLKTVALEDRKRFELARALAALGPPMPAFAETRKALERADGRVVGGVSWAFAQRSLEVLAAHGVPAELRSTGRAPRASGRASLLLGGLLLVGAGAAFVTGKVPASLAHLTRTADTDAAVALPGPKTLTTQELSQRWMPSTVSLRCESSVGSGFFVGEDLLLTNAHVACPVGKVMEVTLSSGRRVMGQTLERDELLDLATVRVSGARGEPLPLGDATLLAPGDPLVFIGSPKGLSFTVHEGKVSHLGREYLGAGYVQFDATVNPGNSGGPLFNARGEVVGVVSLKVTDAEGIGLALPIQYAQKLVPMPGSPETAQRWKALLDTVAREEERELDQFRMEPYRPALLGVEDGADVGLIAVLVERFPQVPSRMNHRFELQSDAGTCAMAVEVTLWKPLMEAAKDADNTRRLRWLASKGLTKDLYVGATRLPVETCMASGSGEGWLSVDKGSPELSRARLAPGRVEKARAWWKERSPRTSSAGSGTSSYPERESSADAYARQQRESEWRGVFHRTHSAILALEEERRKVAKQDAMGYSVRGTLDDLDRRLKRAREYLADLERQASNESIPREWRQ